MKKSTTTMMGAVVILLVGLGVICAHAEALDLSGTWKLNAEKSDFGNMPKPTVNVVMKIEHNEPGIKWTSPSFSQKGESTCESIGAIDGKDYRLECGEFSSVQSFKRISPSVIKYVAKSTEGETIGTGTWTISEDRKVLTQKANTRDMNGEPLTVIQVFEKQ